MARNDVGPFFVIRNKQGGYLEAGCKQWTTPKLYTKIGARSALGQKWNKDNYEIVPVTLTFGEA